MASLVASSSRFTLSRTSSELVRKGVVKRHFASSSRIQDRQVSITFANRSATFTIPSLSTLLDPLLVPAKLSEEPTLAGIPSAFLQQSQESSEEATDVLDWDGFLNAVPKSKVSHSRKAMRSANKGLKDRVDFVHCASCGQPKLAHHICASCFSTLNRAHKAVKKANAKEEARKEAMATRLTAKIAKSKLLEQTRSISDNTNP